MIRVFYAQFYTKLCHNLQMRNSKNERRPQWFSMLTWLLIVLCMDMASAQGSVETIARRARADAELEIIRRNDISRSRAAMARPSALFMSRKYPLSLSLSLSL